MPRDGFRVGISARQFLNDGNLIREVPIQKMIPERGTWADLTFATTVVRNEEADSVLKHPHSVDNVIFLPDGRLLATSAGPVVRLWDLTTQECIERYKGSRGRIAALELHPGGRLLMAGGVGGGIRSWDVTTRRELPGRDWRIGTIYDLAFSPDGMTAAAAGHQGVMVWDVDDV